MSDDWTPGWTPATARQAAQLRWARESDPRKATQAARDAFLERFLTAVDPAGQLDPAERELRAQEARRVHMLRLAHASVAARKRKGGRS